MLSSLKPEGGKPSVMVAVPCYNGDIRFETTQALLDTQEVALKHGMRFEVVFVTGSLVHHARSLAALHFLDSDYDRLFWLDSDIKFTALDFIKLVQHTNTHDCAVGVYPRRSDPPGYFVAFARPGEEPNDQGLVEILGTGLGFACVRRSVMQRLAAEAPKLILCGSKEPVPHIFRTDDDGREARGEDGAFWADVNAAGFKIWADATITLGHVGRKVYQCQALQLAS
jgi:hypothetical protein